MKPEKNLNTEEILNSLDGTKKATAPAFFYTRLKARMEKAYEPQKKRPLVLRPAYAFAALLLVVLINMAVILKGDNATDNNVTDTEAVYSIASEYRLNDIVIEEIYK